MVVLLLKQITKIWLVLFMALLVQVQMEVAGQIALLLKIIDLLEKLKA